MSVNIGKAWKYQEGDQKS